MPKPRPRAAAVRPAPVAACETRTRARASANAIGIGASSHHSGSTSVLMETEPSKKLAAATLAPYHTKIRQQTSPMDVSDPFQHPGGARRQRLEHDVDADVLAAPQQPGRGEQGDEIENVLGQFVARGHAAEADVTEQDIGADHHRHEQKQEAGGGHHAVQQASVPPGHREHPRARHSAIWPSGRIP